MSSESAFAYANVMSSVLSDLEQFVTSGALEEKQDFAFVEMFINENPEYFMQFEPQLKPNIKRRVSRGRPKSYNDSSYGRMLSHPEIQIENSWIARKFRRRFRVSYDVFMLLCKECEEQNVFKQLRQGKIPIKYKVLVCLRILGRDLVADDIELDINIAESTIYPMFKRFCEGMVDKLYTKYIKLPEGDELSKIKDVYSRMGMPGAIGSMDCTHVYWNQCPSELGALCRNGKKDGTTVVFQVMVDHSRKVHHCSVVFNGTTSDKNVTKLDTLPTMLMGDKYANEVFYTYTADGNRIEWRGAYVIVDGGYLKYSVYINPMNNKFGINEVMWSEWLESVRKDIECFFGILKARFCFFRNAIRYHDSKLIEKAFQTACILHNMLHEFDGLDRFDWTTVNPEEEEEEDEPEDDEAPREPVLRPAPLVPAQSAIIRTMQHRPTLYYSQLREALVAHFNYMYLRGYVSWPRQLTNRQRLLFPLRNMDPALQPAALLPPPAMPALHRRLQDECLKHLYKKKSFLFREGLVAGQYTRSIGLGLFSRLNLRTADRIVYFVGTVVDRDTHNARNSGYCILLSKRGDGEYLECVDHYRRGECLASAANDPRRCFNTETQEMASSNARLCVGKSGDEWRVSLVATKAIAAGQEIIWSYGSAYTMP